MCVCACESVCVCVTGMKNQKQSEERCTAFIMIYVMLLFMPGSERTMSRGTQTQA